MSTTFRGRRRDIAAAADDNALLLLLLLLDFVANVLVAAVDDDLFVDVVVEVVVESFAAVDSFVLYCVLLPNDELAVNLLRGCNRKANVVVVENDELVAVASAVVDEVDDDDEVAVTLIDPERVAFIRSMELSFFVTVESELFLIATSYKLETRNRFTKTVKPFTNFSIFSNDTELKNASYEINHSITNR